MVMRNYLSPTKIQREQRQLHVSGKVKSEKMVYTAASHHRKTAEMIVERTLAMQQISFV